MRIDGDAGRTKQVGVRCTIELAVKNDRAIRLGELFQSRRQLTATGNVELPTMQFRDTPRDNEWLESLARIMSPRKDHPFSAGRDRSLASAEDVRVHDASEQQLRHSDRNSREEMRRYADAR